MAGGTCGQLLDGSLTMSLNLIHGGADDGPPIAWDFSSNANAVPMPDALQTRLLQADRRGYPDPHYTALRQRLADAVGTTAEAIVPPSGSSEAIRRLTLAAWLRGIRQVGVPQHAYADYAAAAQALGMDVRYGAASDGWASSAEPMLLWLCEPCNPSGTSLPRAFWLDLAAHPQFNQRIIVAVDRAYEPLRLVGLDPIPDDVAASVWQLWSPNKALGLTGVRAGWVQAPLHDPWGLRETMLSLAPSWDVSAEGVHLLTCWLDADTQQWLSQAKVTLSGWLIGQQAALSRLGWQHRPTHTPFFLTRPADGGRTQLADLLADLRQQGIKLRDAASFGLDGWLRVRAHQPHAQQALIKGIEGSA